MFTLAVREMHVRPYATDALTLFRTHRPSASSPPSSSRRASSDRPILVAPTYARAPRTALAPAFVPSYLVSPHRAAPRSARSPPPSERRFVAAHTLDRVRDSATTVLRFRIRPSDRLDATRPRSDVRFLSLSLSPRESLPNVVPRPEVRNFLGRKKTRRFSTT